METELKLSIAPEHIAKLAKLPIIVTHSLYPPVTKRLVSVYYDTPKFVLQQRGVAVRLRKDGRRWLQTIKLANSAAGGLHQRVEWETATQENTLDFNVVNDAELRAFFAQAHVADALRAVFVTDFQRTQRILRFGADDIEFCIDRGQVNAGRRSEPICEVELELKRGAVTRLFDVANAICAAVPLHLEASSKAERGYVLARRQAYAPSKAGAVTLAAEQSPAEAFAAIAKHCLAHLQANERGVRENLAPEFLHQARVALRRLRSACSLFKAELPEASEAIQQELRWLTGELNDARNWDVFATETLAPIVAACPKHRGLGRLKAQVKRRRSTAHARASAALQSSRYTGLLLRLGGFLIDQLERGAMAKPLREFASETLSARHQRLLKRGKGIAKMDAPARHALRIAAKKQRYACEFLQSLFPAESTRSYRRRLAELQDALGALNDAATAQQLVRSLPASRAVPELEARAIVLGWVSGESTNKMRSLKVIWAEFNNQQVFWR